MKKRRKSAKHSIKEFKDVAREGKRDGVAESAMEIADDKVSAKRSCAYIRMLIFCVGDGKWTVH